MLTSCEFFGEFLVNLTYYILKILSMGDKKNTYAFVNILKAW